MYKFILITFFLVNMVFSQNTVKDFAPLKIGNTWEYSYTDTSYTKKLAVIIIETTIEHSIMRIEVMDSHISGKDTVYLLQSQRNGFKITMSRTDTTNESISVVGSDSVIVNGSGISRGTGYQCPIFPFYFSHDFDTTSSLPWDETTIGQNTLIRVLPDNPHGSIYVQNIGATFFYYWTLVNSFGIFRSGVLLSFNNQPIESAIKNQSRSLVEPISCSHKIGRLTIPLGNTRTLRPIRGVLLNGMTTRNSTSMGTVPIVTDR